MYTGITIMTSTGGKNLSFSLKLQPFADLFYAYISWLEVEIFQ